MVVPQGIQAQLLTLADALAFLLADRLMPDSLRQRCLKFVHELKDELPIESRCDVEAAEARAVLRALAYRREAD